MSNDTLIPPPRDDDSENPTNLPFYTPEREFDVIPFPAFWEARMQRLREIIRLCDVPAEHRQALVEEPLLRFGRQCYLMPASADHHDPHRGGLVDHSLHVCSTALAQAPNHQFSWEDRVAELALCLCHDTGKAQQMQVLASKPGPKPWDPLSEPMADWCEHHQLDRIVVRWIPGRAKRGELAAEPLGLHFLATRIFPPSLMATIGIARYNTIQYSFLKQIAETSKDYYTLFKRADIDCARSPRIVGTDLRNAFFIALREAILARPDNVNAPNAEIFCSRTHTAVALARLSCDDQTRGKAWRVACKALAHAVEPTGQWEVDRQILRDPTIPFIRQAAPPIGDKSVIFYAGDKTRRQSVVIPNTLLWGEQAPWDRITPYAGTVVISGLGKVLPKVNELDLGFAPSRGNAYVVCGTES